MRERGKGIDIYLLAILHVSFEGPLVSKGSQARKKVSRMGGVCSVRRNGERSPHSVEEEGGEEGHASSFVGTGTDGTLLLLVLRCVSFKATRTLPATSSLLRFFHADVARFGRVSLPLSLLETSFYGYGEPSLNYLSVLSPSAPSLAISLLSSKKS